MNFKNWFKFPTIYNFNLGIGWASSGVEYAQAYRAKILRNIGIEAKYVFTDMFPRDNIQHMTENIGMTIGLLPITGVPLPFVSYGGSSLVTNFICIGLLLNISSRRQKAIFVE